MVRRVRPRSRSGAAGADALSVTRRRPPRRRGSASPPWMGRKDAGYVLHEGLEAVFLRRQPVARAPLVHDHELHAVLVNAVHERPRLADRRKPDHLPPRVVIDHVHLAGHDHRGVGRVHAQPLARFDVGIRRPRSDVEREIVQAEPGSVRAIPMPTSAVIASTLTMPIPDTDSRRDGLGSAGRRRRSSTVPSRTAPIQSAAPAARSSQKTAAAASCRLPNRHAERKACAAAGTESSIDPAAARRGQRAAHSSEPSAAPPGIEPGQRRHRQEEPQLQIPGPQQVHRLVRHEVPLGHARRLAATSSFRDPSRRAAVGRSSAAMTRSG